MTRKPPGSRTPSGGSRLLHSNVKTARGRSNASTRWLQRQLNDPYVQQAKRDGYRSRAAYKLLELQKKHQFLKPGQRVVDLGAAPGGWTQVAVEIVKPDSAKGSHGVVVGTDILEISPISGAVLVTVDFLADGADQLLIDAIGGRADAVLSDMAPSFTGHPATDHLRTMVLIELALDMAERILTPGGVFLAKIIQGADEAAFLLRLKQKFTKVRMVKPPASRKESAEHYVLATGFRG